MDLTKDALSDAIERLRRRMGTGEINEEEFRAARNRLLERRHATRPFEGAEQRTAPPSKD